jgi:hypothetical protein
MGRTFEKTQLTRMPKAGLEPACLAAPPPQDGVSANSTTSADQKIYFDDFSAGGAGVAGGGAGLCAGGGAVSLPAAGASAGLGSPAGAAVPAGTGVFASEGTTERLPGLPERIVSPSDVTMKMIAAAVVAFESNVADPRCPNAV